MYCIARQCVLPAVSQEQADHLLSQAALQSLAEVLEAVPDPRGKHGLRYDLPFLLTCLIAALLCNCDGTEAVAGWCRDQGTLLREVFGPRLFLTPSGSLYRWLLPSWMPLPLSACWEPGCKPRQPLLSTSRWPWMARPCGAPDQASRLLPIC